MRVLPAQLLFFGFVDDNANRRPHCRANRAGDHEATESARSGALFEVRTAGSKEEQGYAQAQRRDCPDSHFRSTFLLCQFRALSADLALLQFHTNKAGREAFATGLVLYFLLM